MYSNIDSVKDDLQDLCSKYLGALKVLEQKKIISKNDYDKCSKDKIIFLDIE